MIQPVTFFKMNGSGNDFIILDNRSGVVDDAKLPTFINRVCRRKMSVGADGFILIEPSEKADFRWRFYNSDGSKAEMCGNGARCAARFAFVNGIAGEILSFETEAGIIEGQVKDDRAKVKMPDPIDLRLDYSIEVENSRVTLSSVNTGVPHAVIMKHNVEDVDVFSLGRKIRYHEAFAPAGTNVNFVCQLKHGELAIRTYERGVEDETLACGTGSIAGALIASCKAGWTSPISLVTKSGESLTIFFSNNNGEFSDIYLEGDARIIYTGKIWEDAWKP